MASWRDFSAVKSTYKSFRSLGFCVQQPLVTHNYSSRRSETQLRPPWVPNTFVVHIYM